jgi:hypothetical protein
MWPRRTTTIANVAASLDHHQRRRQRRRRTATNQQTDRVLARKVTVRKKVDQRIRTLIENGVKLRHRTFVAIVGTVSNFIANEAGDCLLW